MINTTVYKGALLPEIKGGKGGGKGGNGTVSPNSLFSTDVLLMTIGLGEGPLYRINPNGPQDVEIQDSSIDDLLDRNRYTDKGVLNTNYGNIDSSKFMYSIAYGTSTQAPLRFFGSETVVPQAFSSPIPLKRGGDVTGVYTVRAESATSAGDWDSINFNFVVSQLAYADTKGNVSPSTVSLKISVYSVPDRNLILTDSFSITGKTDSGFRYQRVVAIPSASKSANGYYFIIEKTSADSDQTKYIEDIRVTGWDEIKNEPMAYPRTALIGYAIKATPEHSGGVPNITSLVKGLIVKVPSNYNQPILADNSIDWRQIEVSDVGGTYPYTTGYRLQKTGTTILTSANPEIYIGTWDGTFLYSWTQNPAWILFDLLTNNIYGMGISEEFIDKYKFYQVAQYCDACDPFTGRFIGVKGLADGSFRHKPLNYNSSDPTEPLKTQIGIPSGTPIIERRFTLNISITEQEKGMDILNKLAATFRSVLVYAGGKITLAIDMPDELPSLIFNETNIKEGTFLISGVKESDLITGVDVTYTDPTNHYKKETVRVDLLDADAGISSSVDNILSLDLDGVTRRSQAMRMAQYHIASNRYVRRNLTFTTGTEALSLNPGDVISVSGQTTGVNYGYGGIVTANSALNEANIFLEHYTIPALTNSVFTANTKPLALRVIRAINDKISTYILSNTDFSLAATGNAASGNDYARVVVTGEYNPLTKNISAFTGFTSDNIIRADDYWSLGEWLAPSNIYSNKAGRLFKVTAVNRENLNEVTVSASEYIANVYTDSDSFINYEPIPYTDITSPLSLPPTPYFTFTTRPVMNYNNTVSVQGIVQSASTKDGYNQSYSTEYYIAYPQSSNTINSIINANNNSYKVNDSVYTNGSYASLVGKNGFTSDIGYIKLLCTSYIVDSFAKEVALTVPGLSSVVDDNTNEHIFDAGRVLGFTDTVKISVPINDKKASDATKNFVGYVSNISYIAVPVLRRSGDVVYLADTTSGGGTLSSLLSLNEFYIIAYQPLKLNSIYDKSFYISGSTIYKPISGKLSTNITTATNYTLPIKPFSAQDFTLYIDGKKVTLENTARSGININKNNPSPAYFWYTTQNGETDYRIEISKYSVPAIERYDTVEISYNNTFTVTNTSYDPADPLYNPAQTANNIFWILLDKEPAVSVQGRTFKNITQNPIGLINNVNGTSFTFDYSTKDYPGLFNLSNNEIYSLQLNSTFNKYFLAENGIIPELQQGYTTLKARNRNITGRSSPYVEKSVFVENIPIQKVENVQILEEIYLEQLGGAAVRITVLFDHIKNQQVTDYEISYRLIEGDITSQNVSLSDYNTVKVAATGVDSNNKIRFSINNVNRGAYSLVNSVEFKITALSNNIRGLERVVKQAIVGKTAKPQNIEGFTGGQQGNNLFFAWRYKKDANNNLIDLDLKEVTIRRLPGIAAASIDNFLIASDFYVAAYPATTLSTPIDFYDTYTYLVRTKDTSGNWSDSVSATTLYLVKNYTDTVIAAYSEDTPTIPITALPNVNNTEAAFASFYVVNGGFRKPNSIAAANANGTSSGWSVSPTGSTDLLATANAYYYTQVRDLGATYTGTLRLDFSGYQVVESTYNTYKDTKLSSVSQLPITGYTLSQSKQTVAGVQDMHASPEGTNLYFVVTAAPANVSQYTLTTPWDISTAVFTANTNFATETAPTGIFVHPSGNYYFAVGTANDRVTRYNMTSKWNVASSVMADNISVITNSNNPRAVRFSPDGSNMYILSQTILGIAQYNLSNAWDIQTAVYTQTYSNLDDAQTRSFAFAEDGYKLYTVGINNDNVNSYYLTEAWNIASAVYQANLYIGAVDGAPGGIYFPNYGNFFLQKGQNINLRKFIASTLSSNVLIDNTRGGIGNYINSFTNGRYDSNNRTYMTGGQNGEVWAIWNPGQFVNDTANANSYALIAGIINGNSIAIGDTFYANGNPAVQNNFSNITFGGSSYLLVNLRQYNDLGDATYSGTDGAVATKTYIKYATNNVYYSNGNVNPSAFTSDFTEYSSTKNTFRYFQIKHEIANKVTNEVDYVLDRLRYTVNKDKITYSNVVTYTSSPMNVAFDGTDFVFPPAINLTVMTSNTGAANALTTIIQGSSNSWVTFKVIAANGTGDYPANGTAKISVSAIGV